MAKAHALPQRDGASPTRRTAAAAVRCVALAIAYFATAKAGLQLSFANGSITAVWPPSGLALGAVVIWGYRALPGVAAGALLANATTNAPTAAVLAITAGNTLEAAVGAWLLRRASVQPSLPRVRDVVAFAVLAAGLSTMVSATIGVGSLLATGALPVAAASGGWRVWWLGDATGDLLFGSSVMLVATRARTGDLIRRRALEAAGVAAALATVCVLVFTQPAALAYAVFPVLAWAALRFHQAGAVVGGLIVSSIAVWCTAKGHGPFAGSNPDYELLRAQTFAGVMTLTALVLAAARSQQEQASDAERNLAEAQQLALIGSWEWSPGGRHIQASRELRRLFALPAEATLDDFIERVHPSDQLALREALEAAATRRSAFELELRLPAGAGGERTIRARGRSHPAAPDASNATVSGTCQDITSQVRADERFRNLLESAPDAIIIVDTEGKIVLVNAQTEKLFGYARRQLIGASVDTLVPAALRAAHGKRRESFARRPEVRPMGIGSELSARHRDGHEIPVEISLSPLQTDDGMLVSAIVRDVSDRRAAEQATRRLAAIVEQTDDAVFAKTPEGVITEWNRAAERLYGYTAAEMVGRSVSAIIAPDRRGEEQDIMRRVMAGEGVEHHETVRIRRDGGPVDVSITVSPLHDASGRIIAASTIARDISQRKHFEGQLQHLADHDPLTGLLNRRRFETELDAELLRARRFGMAGAVLAIDLDHFKYVNDSLGHSVGDKLIVRTAELLRGRLRSTDVLARLGGDEFAVILPGVDSSQAEVVAADLVSVVGSDAYLLPDHETGRVTATIGVAPFAPETSASAEELLIEADIAMYDAKEAGRNRACTYHASSQRQDRMRERLAWVERIRHALDAEDFVLYAQPIAALGPRPDPLPRHELLVRMVGDDGDLVPPGAFLPVAESFELIQAIDRWVLRQAIALLAAEQRKGHELCLQVNVSAKSVGDPTVAALIAAELQRAGADGRGLCLEITESTAIVNVEHARRFAADMRELGCKVALDDFGAGFASFYYLKHLDFDFIKIDGEFVRGIADDPTNQLVVKSMVDIARGLGKQTIAEFVGDGETLELLTGYGVDFAQGFHIGEPAPLAAADLTSAAAA